MCISVVLVSLHRRGAENWSTGFAALWYGFWAAAIALALAGTVIALRQPGLRLGGRIVAVVLSSITLAASVFLAWSILSLLDSVS